ncbi:MAG: hypothetical protein COX80_00995 [Candidatus Magasanikbacteria bacterium CG_4_10_14_0_2_um_filter_33_14]|uniref:Uncharacterized protein n=1 Tax=Candidatus Magasanikbacteria bacterium CG_4_10_14_0_2_um_filter_33_14 TaxID=1974636 RepID=A0A2M7VBY4_9BACT|nr:MAG: hypothetical protein COX80_00995 [Candidatus Magasanikbacteria bacterium CG_4_10_14_0_2_um_filter_33_14]
MGEEIKIVFLGRLSWCLFFSEKKFVIIKLLINKYKYMEVNKKKIFKLDIMFFVVLLAVGFYFFWKSAPEATAPANEDNLDIKVSSSSDLPEGVVVTDLGDGNKLVINDTDKYTVKVSDVYYVEQTKDKNLAVTSYSDQSQINTDFFDYRVIFISHDNSLEDLENYVKDKCSSNLDCNSYNIEEVFFNDMKWYKVTYNGDYVGAGWPEFFSENKGQTYSLLFQFADSNFINNILTNFKFVN